MYFVQRPFSAPATVNANADGANRTAPNSAQATAADGQILAHPAAAPRAHDTPQNAAQYSAHALLAQRDLRAAAEGALCHPELGGVFHAQALRRLCFDIVVSMPNVEAMPPNAPHDLARRHQTALDDLRQRCAGFSSEELNGKVIHELAFDPRAKGDPLMQLQASWTGRTSLGPTELDTLRAQILSPRDPLLLWELGPELSLDSAGGTQRYHLDGQAYTDAQAEVFNLAWRSAVCGVGAGCGAADVNLTALCAENGLCGETLQQAILDGVHRAYGAADVALFQRLVVRIEQVIATADANALRVPG